MSLPIPEEIQPAVESVVKNATSHLSYIFGFPIRLVVVVETEKVTEGTIKNLVCRVFNVSWEEVITTSKEQKYVGPRQAYCYLCKMFIKGKKLREIAADINVTDHSSVIHSIRAVEDHISTQDERVGRKVASIIGIISGL